MGDNLIILLTKGVLFHIVRLLLAQMYKWFSSFLSLCLLVQSFYPFVNMCYHIYKRNVFTFSYKMVWTLRIAWRVCIHSGTKIITLKMMTLKETVFFAFLALTVCFATTTEACDCIPPELIVKNGCQDSFIAVVTLTGKHVCISITTKRV